MLFLVVRSTMEENVGGGQRSWRVRGFRCWGYSRQSLRLYGEKGGMTWGTSPVAVPRGFQQEAPARAALQGGIVPCGRSAEWQEDWGWPWGRVERMSSLELGWSKVMKDQCISIVFCCCGNPPTEGSGLIRHTLFQEQSDWCVKCRL